MYRSTPMSCGECGRLMDRQTNIQAGTSTSRRHTQKQKYHWREVISADLAETLKVVSNLICLSSSGYSAVVTFSPLLDQGWHVPLWTMFSLY